MVERQTPYGPKDIFVADGPSGTWVVDGRAKAVGQLIDTRVATALAVVNIDQSGFRDIVASFGGEGVWVSFTSQLGREPFKLIRPGKVEALFPCECD